MGETNALSYIAVDGVDRVDGRLSTFSESRCPFVKRVLVKNVNCNFVSRPHPPPTHTHTTCRTPIARLPLSTSRTRTTRKKCYANYHLDPTSVLDSSHVV
jgi:hypothetical protein